MDSTRILELCSEAEHCAEKESMSSVNPQNISGPVTFCFDCVTWTPVLLNLKLYNNNKNNTKHELVTFDGELERT